MFYCIFLQYKLQTNLTNVLLFFFADLGGLLRGQDVTTWIFSDLLFKFTINLTLIKFYKTYDVFVTHKTKQILTSS